MSLHDVSDLLQAACEQPEPQRLLLVFAVAELPDDASDDERHRFARGEGGTLAPTLCVDKTPGEIRDFNALVEESRQTGIDWDILFIAAMSGRRGRAPNADEVKQPLQMMAEAIKNGRIDNFIAVNRDGELVQLQRG